MLLLALSKQNRSESTLEGIGLPRILSSIGWNNVIEVSESCSKIAFRYPFAENQSLYFLLVIEKNTQRTRLMLGEDLLCTGHAEEAIQFAKTFTERKLLLESTINQWLSQFIMVRSDPFITIACCNFLKGTGEIESVEFNLMHELELQFPENAIPIAESSSFECPVCASIWIEAAPIDIECMDCAAKFHKSCLMDWFTTDPEAKRAFGVIRGRCLCCHNGTLRIETGK